MADSKSFSKLSRKTKSSSSTNHNNNNNNNKPTASSSKSSKCTVTPSKCAVCPICSAKSKNASSNDMFCKAHSGSCGMLLDKLDLQYFKETTLKKMKSSLNSSFPAAREACIEYALDMVISNLIQNGHLEPSKAPQMRSQLMKTQIAAICDEMLSAKAEISKASKSRIRYRSKPSRSPSKSTSKNRNNNMSSLSHRDPRRRTQPRKWAIQPLALPITIVPDQLQKLPHFRMMEKINLSMKETGSVRAFKNMSADSIKKQRSGAQSPKQHKAKSLESSLEKKATTKSSPPQLPVPPSPKQASEKRHANSSFRNHQTSSEVPSSNHSLENNLKLLSQVSSDKSIAKSKGKKSKSDLVVEVTKGNSKTNHREEDYNKNIIVPAKKQPTNSDNEKVDHSKREASPTGVGVAPSVQKPESPPRQASPVPPSKEKLDAPIETEPPSQVESTKTVTISSMIGSNTTIASTTSSGYHVLVDLKGFQNNEISMEVQGRQLLFLAARPRKNDFNARKVSEIVDVPISVKMENLKIGRRSDGYVLIEECDHENNSQP